MQKISIVVPTLWKFEPFSHFVNEVAQIDSVDVIVVVDNNSSQRPNVQFHKKIKFLDFGCNIFVNPAWNAGAYHCSGDIICFMNDDVIFDLQLFALVAAQMRCEQGLWGYCRSEMMPSISVTVHQHKVPHGFGQLFFIHKKNFVDIPNEFLVHCGDNFLFDTLKKRYNSNCLIEGLAFYTPSSVSSRSFDHLHVKTCLMYERLRQERKLPPASTSTQY